MPRAKSIESYPRQFFDTAKAFIAGVRPKVECPLGKSQAFTLRSDLHQFAAAIRRESAKGEASTAVSRLWAAGLVGDQPVCEANQPGATADWSVLCRFAAEVSVKLESVIGPKGISESWSISLQSKSENQSARLLEAALTNSGAPPARPDLASAAQESLSRLLAKD